MVKNGVVAVGVVEVVGVGEVVLLGEKSIASNPSQLIFLLKTRPPPPHLEVVAKSLKGREIGEFTGCFFAQ